VALKKRLFVGWWIGKERERESREFACNIPMLLGSYERVYVRSFKEKKPIDREEKK
jgi:hypothetical protein